MAYEVALSTADTVAQFADLMHRCLVSPRRDYVAFEGLAGSGKSTLIGLLRRCTDERCGGIVYLDELYLPAEKQSTIDYISMERHRFDGKRFSGRFHVSDRSVISTIVVAAAKELAGLNTTHRNWDDLLSWMSADANVAAVPVPARIVLPLVSAEVSIVRQRTRKKYRSSDSFFLNRRFCEVSALLFDLCVEEYRKAGLNPLVLYCERVTEEEALSMVVTKLAEWAGGV